MPKVVITGADEWLVVDGHRIVGYLNNREGLRKYRRDLRHGKGFIRIPVVVEEKA